MSDGKGKRLERWLLAWSRAVRRRAPVIVSGIPVVVAALGWYAAGTLRVSTDTSSLVSDDLPYRQIYNEYRAAFPGSTDRLVVVIEARTAALADHAARVLTAGMRADTGLFESVYAPGVGAFWDRAGLLFIPTDTLRSLVDRVEAAAPLLRDLEADPTLGGLAGVLDASDDGDGRDLAPVLGLLAATVNAASAGRVEPVPWSALVRGRLPAGSDLRRVLTVIPRLAFDNRVPGVEAIERVREIASSNGLVERRGVRVRLTGSVAIEADEL
ncbi:MAG: hypothetical protein R3195_13040, partial [Gemmatimonadota bacterium]|nr:hypothetical protein [Gemmatimonadota bacterium]